MSKSTIPSTMRAHIFTSTAPTLEANLRLVRDAPLPQNAHSLGADQALVRVMATSLNPADYKLASLPLIGRFLVPRPSTPGLDFAGRIAATSPTSALREGALVFGRLSNPQKYGTLAEYIVAGRQEVVPLPSNVSVEDAACIGTAGLVAYQSIASYVGRGSNVFIHGGSGGTGSFGIQVAKVLGCHVTTTCSTANVERCKELGADEVIDYRTTDVVRALKTGSRVMQHVVDNVGTEPRLWDEMTRWTDSNAAYVQVGADVSLSAVTDIMKSKRRPGDLQYVLIAS